MCDDIYKWWIIRQKKETIFYGIISFLFWRKKKTEWIVNVIRNEYYVPEVLFTYYDLVLNHECLSTDLRPREAVDKVKILKWATRLEQFSFPGTSTGSSKILVIPSIYILFLYCKFCNNIPFAISIFKRTLLLKKCVYNIRYAFFILIN